ncbi:ABC-three component system protein [Vibrio parahaemolyticus]|nr:hypothetical protein [Vibrio parahaemolyticus]
MLKKLKLKRADEYDYLVATLYAIEASIAYLKGTPCFQRIGNEQGDIDEWDDVVLHQAQNRAVHCQVKRQMEDFCARGLERTNKRQSDQLQDLSALDSAFTSLAKFFNDQSSPIDKKQFRLSIPHPKVQIKKDLSIVNLRDVCVESKKAGATLETFSSADGNTAKVRTWLQSWCGFENSEAMFNCIRRLEICIHDDEDRINLQCRQHLEYWYNDPDDVRLKITNFLASNASSEQSITPRMILAHVAQHMKPQATTWARYEKIDRMNWSVSGTLSGSADQIEPPIGVVSTLWNQTANRSLELQIQHSSNSPLSCNLDLSIIRLALHAPSSVKLSLRDADVWKTNISNTVRHTLGMSINDLNTKVFLNHQASCIPDEHRSLTSLKDVTDETEQLTSCMDSINWRLIKEQVNDFVCEHVPGEVQDSIDHVWSSWQKEIDSNLQHQNTIASDMLYAFVEGDRKIGLLRAGPITASLVAEAFEVLLYLAVGLDAEDMNWDDFCKDLSIRTIALSYWAGPNSNPAKARKFFDRDKRPEQVEFLGKETSKILVLPQVSVSQSSVYGRTLASDQNEGESIADSRTPRSVITRSFEFQDAIDTNSVEYLKQYVQGIVNKRQLQRQNHISSLTIGS